MISDGTLKTPRDKLLFFIYKKLCYAGLLFFSRAVQFVKNPAVLFTFHRFYGIIQLIDKLELTR